MQGNEIRIDKCQVCDKKKPYVAEFPINHSVFQHEIVRICLDCLMDRVRHIKQKKQGIEQSKEVVRQP